MPSCETPSARPPAPQNTSAAPKRASIRLPNLDLIDLSAWPERAANNGQAHAVRDHIPEGLLVYWLERVVRL